jgi:hypothetical protein
MRLADWWFRAVHIGQATLFVLLSLAFWYAVSRIVLGWVNYAAIAKPEHRVAPPDLQHTRRAALDVRPYARGVPSHPLPTHDLPAR